MITYDNYESVLKTLDSKQLNRILKSRKEFIVLELSCSNCCSWLNIKLTDNFDRYKNVSNYGNCILQMDNFLTSLKEFNIITEKQYYDAY